MSASLVGSEMCIRDSPRRGPGDSLRLRARGNPLNLNGSSAPETRNAPSRRSGGPTVTHH
eukprot:11887987-Alexandrium_andersonii.AAC.1